MLILVVIINDWFIDKLNCSLIPLPNKRTKWTSEGSPSAISFERRDRCLEIMEAPEKGLVGNGAHTHKNVLDSLAHLKCIYTNARSISNKQGELEAMMQHENYDLVAITEMWWDASRLEC